ncbi:disulfide bond formation protein DsbA [Nocardia brasiliensis]|uniref:DsbA family protein n=1 Tax=Nocardia brasiliensis TaxID=37326 RepID=UPI0037A681CA
MSHESEPSPARVEFYFDPICPYAWIASRWVLEVEKLRPLDRRFRVMSLSVLNADNPDLPEKYRARLADGWPPVRAVAALAALDDPTLVDRYYTEFGTRFHHARMRDRKQIIEESLTAIGAPRSVLAAAYTTEFDDAVRRSHRQAMAAVGPDVGTPIIEIDGAAVFGPVLSAVPRGRRAVELFDAVTVLAACPAFAELKRARTDESELG